MCFYPYCNALGAVCILLDKRIEINFIIIIIIIIIKEIGNEQVIIGGVLL